MERIDFAPEALGSCQDCVLRGCLECGQEEIADSPAGRLLGAIGVRYSAFAWDDQEKFKRYLGDDVDPVVHGYYQAVNVAIPFVKAQNEGRNRSFTYDEAKDLVLANLYHDVHEAYTGDIPYPDKTRESDEAELKVSYSTLAELGMHPNLNGRINRVMGDFDGETFVGRAFNLVEHIGYLETGLKAWNLRDCPTLTQDEKDRSREMGLKVVASAIPKITDYKWTHSYVGDVLMSNIANIREVAVESCQQ